MANIHPENWNVPSETLFCQFFVTTLSNSFFSATLASFSMTFAVLLLRSWGHWNVPWRYQFTVYEMTGQFRYILKAYIYIQRSSKHSTTRTEDFGNAVLVEPGRVANGKLERLRFKDCIGWGNGDIRNGDAGQAQAIATVLLESEIKYENMPGLKTWLNLPTQLTYNFGLCPPSIMILTCHLNFHSFLGCKSFPGTPYHFEELWQFLCLDAWVAYQNSPEAHAMCTMHAFHVASAMRFLGCRCCWEIEIKHPDVFWVEIHTDKRVVLSYSVHL